MHERSLKVKCTKVYQDQVLIQTQCHSKTTNILIVNLQHARFYQSIIFLKQLHFENSAAEISNTEPWEMII